MINLRGILYGLTILMNPMILSCTKSEPARRFPTDPPKLCRWCDAWNKELEPFQIFGNTYYVGTEGLSTILITSDAGHILLDGALAQSASVIDRNIRTLGFRTEDVKWIANSHAHYDHAGGIAALQRVSRAKVIASDAGAKALMAGAPLDDDPQYGFGVGLNAFPAVDAVRTIYDQERITLGPIILTAHYTPGHTPGSTTWHWQSCEGETCLDIVYADSLNAVSAPGYTFAPIAQRFRDSINKVANLPCDIILTVHPGFMDIKGKLARRQKSETNPFIDQAACQSYAAAALTGLEKRLEEETSLD